MTPSAPLSEPRHAAFDGRFALVLVCFALSGFAGLLYQTSWTREFSFVFGTSGLAVATVLAAYMGGLALGAGLAARYVDRVRRPVLVYGLLELGIALGALAVPHLIELARGLHIAVLRGAGDVGTGAPLALYLGTSFAILCIPTTFMGATLPLLARHAVRSEREIGPRIGALYATNTAGAIVGTLLTAFWLMPALGLRGTIYVGAVVNAIVFAAAALLSRGGAPAPTHPAGPTAGSSATGANRFVLAMALVAGIASFGYEVLWTRLLEHVVGGSVYAFASMLGSFLLGISLGGAIASRFARTRGSALSGMAWAQLGAALAALGAYAGMQQLPVWFEGGVLGDHGQMLRLAAVASGLLLPSTFCIGATFPFAVRALAAEAEDAARASARVYAWNTAGAIVGSLAAGFVVLPWLGFGGTLAALLALNLLVAAAAWSLIAPRQIVFAAGWLALALWLAVLPPETPWRLLRSAPMSRDEVPLGDARGVVFHAVGRSSSVLAIDELKGIRIRTNGVPEAVIPLRGARPGDATTARWLGALPAFKPGGTRRMLVIGLGGGVAVEAVPPTVDHIDVVELEPEVVAANRFVAARRQRDPFADPRVHVRVGDARSVLELEPEPYDAVVSQPSHPWTAGASHLYTVDFFAQVRERLAPDGLFVQWLGLSMVDEPLLRSFVATLLDAFPHVRLYRPHPNGALFVASRSPGAIELEAQVDAVVAAAPDLLAALGVEVPEDLLAALSLDSAGARRFAAGAPIITDDRNLMATRAPRVLNAIVGREDALLAEVDALRGGRAGFDSLYLIDRLCQMRRRARAAQLAATLSDPRERQLGAAIVAAARGERAEAGALLEVLLEQAPLATSRDRVSAQARWRLVELLRGPVARGEARVQPLVEMLGASEAAVVKGWRHELGADRADWAALAELEAALAAVPPRAPHRRAAEALRIAWRLGVADAAAAREALRLLDLNPWSWSPQRLAQRALAASRAGDRPAAVASLHELAARNPVRVSPAVVAIAREAIAVLPREPNGEDERRWLNERFRAGAG